MPGALTVSYVLPVHNCSSGIGEVARRLSDHLQRWPGSEVLLVENGSTDGTLEACRAAALACSTTEVRVVVLQSATGMGLALRRGLSQVRGALVVLSAADLPFGFTDLDAWLSLTPHPRAAMGSKGHHGSHVAVSRQRAAVSTAFSLLRRVTVGLDMADSQGTVLLQRELAQALLPLLEVDDYLIATEICAWSERFGYAVVELPVDYPRSGTSTVRPLQDGWRMAGGLLALRRRLRNVPRGRRPLPEPAWQH